MAENNYTHLIHANSDTIEGGSAKLPSADRIEHGEIAINYAQNSETIFIKNNRDGIVSFLPSNKLINMVSITYDELVTIKRGGRLLPGQMYRITDYVTTTNQSHTRSANHPFDLIVTATDVNKLNENAKAIQHNGNDNYFNNSNLDAWELKYCLENDEDRFAWADTTNGKGVIYYMKDEWGNECPYDFKNILFVENIGDDDVPFFTFTWQSSQMSELSVEGYAKNNVISSTLGECLGSSATYALGFNIIKLIDHDGETIDHYSPIVGNTFGKNCYKNTLHGACDNNKFENGCYYNTLVFNCSNNTFDNECHDNYLNDNSSNNVFGKECHHNTLEDNSCVNVFGNNCHHNTIGNATYGGASSNMFGVNCNNISFGSECYRNSFGISCHDITFGEECTDNSIMNHCSNIILDNYCNANKLDNDCRYIEFRESCNFNLFGNMCTNIILVQNSQFNSFGNNCRGITFFDTCSNCIVENGNMRIDIKTNDGTTVPIENVTILQGYNSGEYDSVSKTTITLTGFHVQHVFKPSDSEVYTK